MHSSITKMTSSGWIIVINHYSIRKFLPQLRFIDDVDMKWTHGDKELYEFLEHANSNHPSIKFTHEVSKSKMSFLDTTTTVKEGNMKTDLYSKPTDKHQYLSPSSCHPKYCFKNISISQAIRAKRICSTVDGTYILNIIIWQQSNSAIYKYIYIWSTIQLWQWIHVIVSRAKLLWIKIYMYSYL